MKRTLKWLAGFVVLVLVVAGGAISAGTAAINAAVDPPSDGFALTPLPDASPAPLSEVDPASATPEDGAPGEIDGPSAEEQALAEGARLADVYACTLCHGGDLGGQDFIVGMPFMNLPAPALTGESQTAEQFERAVRHGIGSAGQSLLVMPSRAYKSLSDSDLSLLYRYASSIPVTDRTLVERSVGPIGRFAALMDGDKLMDARTIDHSASHPTSRPADVGAYLAVVCAACHAEDMGGEARVMEGQEVWASNLTIADEGLGPSWTYEEFRVAMTEGRTKAGAEMDPMLMPWTGFSQMTEAELESLWSYLQARPPVSRTDPR